jgi:ketosteroid isomerase-like protein
MDSSRAEDVHFARDFLDELHAAVNAHDSEAIATLCTEDILWEDPAAPRLLRGRDAVRRFHDDVMFRALPDVRIALIDGPFLSADKKAIAVRTRITGTQTGPFSPPGFAPTNRVLEFETAEFSFFKDAQLARHVVMLDRLVLAAQVGALPPPGSLGERISLRYQHFRAWRARRKHCSIPDRDRDQLVD